MEGVGGARGYGAFTGPVTSDGSVSILRRAGDAAKSEAGAVGDSPVGAAGRHEISADGEHRAPPDPDGVSAEASALPRPVGNLGQHLDLRI